MERNDLVFLFINSPLHLLFFLCISLLLGRLWHLSARLFEGVFVAFRDRKRKLDVDLRVF